MSRIWRLGCFSRLTAGVLISFSLVLPSQAQPAQGRGTMVAKSAPAAVPVTKASPYRPVSVPNRAKNYYLAAWGIDNLLVRHTASGNLIRFSYRVVNPARAKPLGSKLATPYLVGQRSHAMLHVPVMDKVGELRQTGAQGAGQDYWMVFSNKGNLVKVGDRVDVIIGSFHAIGLTVE